MRYLLDENDRAAIPEMVRNECAESCVVFEEDAPAKFIDFMTTGDFDLDAPDFEVELRVWVNETYEPGQPK